MTNIDTAYKPADPRPDCYGTGPYCVGPCARHGTPERPTLWVPSDWDEDGDAVQYQRPVRLADGRRLILTLIKSRREPDGWTWDVSGYERSFDAEYGAHREAADQCRAVADTWVRVVAGTVAARCLADHQRSDHA